MSSVLLTPGKARDLKLVDLMNQLDLHDGRAGPPLGLPMPARPRQTGHSPRPWPLLTALISAGTGARAPAAAEPIFI